MPYDISTYIDRVGNKKNPCVQRGWKVNSSVDYPADVLQLRDKRTK